MAITCAVLATLFSFRCRLVVADTGVGLQASGGGLGTGLAALRERLQLVFGGDATLTLSAVQPHGVRAELDLPEKTGPWPPPPPRHRPPRP